MAVQGTQESGESSWIGKREDQMGMIQVNPRIVSELLRERWMDRSSLKGCIPLGTYRMEETKGLIDEEL